MDTELARTFLTVVSAGNFIRAAERLFVTQSTVSSRIHSLEEQLGCRLFVRNKAGTVLTPAGRQFQKHATTLMRTLEQARHDVGVPQGYRESLTIGGRFGIWEELLIRWLPIMQAKEPGIAIRAEVGFEEDLMLGLVDGRMDIAVMYTPQSRPGLTVEPLLEEELILVQTAAEANDQPLNSNYVYVDWGMEFRTQHNISFPDFAGPGLTVNIGWLGLQHVLASGGAGYFPRRLIAGYLETAQLHSVADAPSFSVQIYLVYPSAHDPGFFASALAHIRDIASGIEAS